ncbi:DNA primase catalytic core [Catenuloplanes nepalensis]|uniref:DNA primase catalytic core n=1 Tax=Catenuloplanes nepalensis TaxID=587533 RepID=A0ABT9MNE5_9ACTN|nr:DNA primase [Catenuloplanes nepalensis]MDP9792950.1 DNA primase catalytic core [Catenuloplanes nepalensis]
MSVPPPGRLIAAHEEAAGFYGRQLPGALPALRYLNSRDIIAATAHRAPWTLGYAPGGWTALRDHLHERGYTDAELLAAGLVTTARTGNVIDIFRERVMFPIRRTDDGAVIAFTGRDVSDWPGAPKYRNTVTTPIYRKRDHLYGLAELTARDLPPAAVFVVEGPADVVALARLGTSTGPCAAVAPCGTALTAEQVAALREAVPAGTPLVLALDADYAGRTATDRAYELLRDWPGPLEAVALPAATDPAELVVRGRDAAEHFLEHHRQPLADLLISQRLTRHRLDEVPGQIAALRHVAPLVADTAARDTAHASALCADLAERLRLDPLTVLEAVYPTPEEPPPQPAARQRETFAVGLTRLPDARLPGVEYAYHCPPDRSAAVRVHHDPSTGITAWVLTEGLTDAPADRVAAHLAADIAARTAPSIGARNAIELARTAVNARFSRPGIEQGDAMIAVLTSASATSTRRLTVAWAGKITAYGATTRSFTTLTGHPTADPTATVRSGSIRVNYIDRPYTQIAISGHGCVHLPAASIRELVEGRPPDLALEELQRAAPSANMVVVRIRATAPQVAAQGRNATTSRGPAPALPAVPHRRTADGHGLNPAATQHR